MAYYDGEFDQFLEDRLKPLKRIQFRNPDTVANPKTVNKKSWRLTRRQMKSLIWLATIYFLLIGLLFGSWGTAYAAMDSLPNEPLYAVKLAGEDLQLLLTSDTAARISLLTTFANRRADEATILASQGQPIPEQITALIAEYQDEIVSLTASPDGEEIPVVGIQKRPQDRDNEGTGDNNRYTGDKSDSAIIDQTKTTIDLEIPDPTTPVTGTVGITGTMNMTQTRQGASWGPGPCESPGSCTPPDEDHHPGPYVYSYYNDDEVAPSHAPGIHEGYGPGYAGDFSQQPPTSSQPIVNDNTKKPTENKGNKP